jgi:hypothetical protein
VATKSKRVSFEIPRVERLKKYTHVTSYDNLATGCGLKTRRTCDVSDVSDLSDVSDVSDVSDE